MNMSAVIAGLNDALRRAIPIGTPGNKIVMSRALASIPADTLVHVWNAVRGFDDFNADNDPHGEHDCATLDVNGAPEQVMFKIDYYDKALEFGSENPADPNVTTRVLTLMLVSDY
jgi:hypothetical protein